MPAIRRCPECDAPLPGGEPLQPCPACLMRLGLESWAARSGTATAGEATGLTKGAFAPPTPVELAPHLPHLEVLELIGRGGMGAVYKVRQANLDRLAALKVLPPELGRDPAFEGRFTREARALARLSHPHIVGVYDFGRVAIHGEGGAADRRLYYFLMEYVEGVNLRQLLRDREVPPQEALAFVTQICTALEFAHEEGVVHRDIKPENILIDRRGRVKIADFGLAKIAGAPAGDGSLTAPEQVVGTLHYMAPEQSRGAREVDHRADIYSLGVVLYELLTGELPLGKFAPPSSRGRVDERLDRVVMRALEPEPDRRYQRANEIKTDVDAVATGTGPVEQARQAGDRTAAPEPPDPAQKLRAFFWMLSSFNVIVLIAGASLCRKRVLWGYEPGWLLWFEKTTNWAQLLPIVLGTLALSTAAYGCVAVWLGARAYPGRGAEPRHARPLHVWLLTTAEGVALTICALGALLNGALGIPWAYAQFAREPVFQVGPVDYSAAKSELGLVVIGLFIGLGAALATTTATRLLPRCPPRLIALAGLAVTLLTALYIAFNHDATTVSQGHRPFYRPWSFAHYWPTPGNTTHIWLTPMPLFTVAFGAGLFACGVVSRRRRLPGRDDRPGAGDAGVDVGGRKRPAAPVAAGHGTPTAPRHGLPMTHPFPPSPAGG